jgi:hypothetical protein
VVGSAVNPPSLRHNFTTSLPVGHGLAFSMIYLYWTASLADAALGAIGQFPLLAVSHRDEKHCRHERVQP